ncbi:hypothetical protein [Sulfurimonas sp. HSL3-7]|uniref:hypothetical protein n=1 Tax=Sulfonitrofixus jiaomeiensis TaxID=3131938 RepID=UPI0031F9F22B
MFGLIRGLFQKEEHIVYIRFRRGKVTLHHLPGGIRYEDEPILAIKKKGAADVITAVGREIQELKPEDPSVVVAPFDSLEHDPDSFLLASKVLSALIRKSAPSGHKLAAPRVIIHPEKSYVSENEAEAYRELVLNAGAAEAVVYVGDTLHPDAFEAILQKS